MNTFKKPIVRQLITHTENFLNEILNKAIKNPYEVTKSFFTTFEHYTIRYYFLEDYHQFCLKINDNHHISSEHLLWIAYYFDKSRFIQTNNEASIEYNGKVIYSKYNNDELFRGQCLSFFIRKRQGKRKKYNE